MVQGLITSWKLLQLFNPDPGLWTYTKCGRLWKYLCRRDLDGILALQIRPLMSHSTNLGDTRIAAGDKMCQGLLSNVRKATIYPPIQQQMRSAVQCIGTALWGSTKGG